MKARKFQSNLGTASLVDSSRLKKLASDVLAWTLDEMQLLMHGQLKVLLHTQVLFSQNAQKQSPLYTRSNL